MPIIVWAFFFAKIFIMKKNILTIILTSSISLLLAQDAPLNMVMKSSTSFENSRLSNIWGYNAPNGKEYALVGVCGIDISQNSVSNVAMSILDITDAANPVRLHDIKGPNSIWREIRTYNQYAYIVTEGGGGITIVDMGGLPASIDTFQFDYEGNLDAIHALHIDNGFLYIYGGGGNQFTNGGMGIFDLRTTPTNPIYVGKYTEKYVHDGIVRGDTAWAGEIYNGTFTVIDISDKTTPKILVEQVTPSAFTHNTWLSTNNKYIYTTDEVSDSYIAAYDISNISNITELDRYRKEPADGAIVHNVYVLNDSTLTGSNTDFVWFSYYTRGVYVLDGTKPDNLVCVGSFDTSPLQGDGFNGAWGVYNYLKSGNILSSNIEGEMMVLTPTYVRACYLEGNVEDATTNNAIGNVNIEINTISKKNLTNGDYKTGIATPGTYNVVFSKPGYITQTINNVVLEAGKTTLKNVKLEKNIVSVQEKLNNLNTFKITDKQLLYSLDKTISLPLVLSIYNVEGKEIENIVLNSHNGSKNIISNLTAGVHIISNKYKSISEKVIVE